MKWEYKILATQTGTVPDDLKEAGENGWELVCIEVQHGLAGSMYSRWIFKRPLRETQWEGQ